MLHKEINFALENQSINGMKIYKSGIY